MTPPADGYPQETRFGHTSRWAGNLRYLAFGVVLPCAGVLLIGVLNIAITHRLSLLGGGVLCLGVAGVIVTIHQGPEPAVWISLDPNGLHDHTVAGQPRDIPWNHLLSVAPDQSNPGAGIVLTVFDPQGMFERQLGVTRVDGSPNHIGMFTDPRVTVPIATKRLGVDPVTLCRRITDYRAASQNGSGQPSASSQDGA